MVELAIRHGSGPVLVTALAESQGISANYIHVLMGGLKTAGLVRSLRGPNGGYELTRKPEDISAFDVVSALEGDTVPVECVSDPGCCPRSAHCVTRDMWCRIAASADEILKSQTLAQLAESQCSQDHHLTYTI
jgi:Rrf2 family protein